MRPVFVIFFIVSLSFTGGAVASAQESSEGVNPLEAQPKAGFIYNDQGKRDPFWPLVSLNGSIINYEKDLLISDMILEGIIREEKGKSIAIINGMIVKPNDTIGLFTVKEIDAHSVVLQKGSQTFVLKLKED